MRRPPDNSIYLTFVIASLLLVTMFPPIPRGMSSFHASSGDIDIADESAEAIIRGSLIGVTFADFAPAQINTPTQTAITPTNTPGPRGTATPLPTPSDTPTFMLRPTETPPVVPMPSSTSTATFTPGPRSSATSGWPESLVRPTATSTATVSWATWTATVAGTATTTASPTAVVLPTLPGTPSSLWDRLADDKPSMWGNKGFYVLLGLIYVTLLGLVLAQVISISRGRS